MSRRYFSQGFSGKSASLRVVGCQTAPWGWERGGFGLKTGDRSAEAACLRFHALKPLMSPMMSGLLWWD